MKKLTAQSLRAGQTVWYASWNHFTSSFEVLRLEVWPDSAPETHPSQIPVGYPRKLLAKYVAAKNGPMSSYSRRRLLTMIAKEERAYRIWDAKHGNPGGF